MTDSKEFKKVRELVANLDIPTSPRVDPDRIPLPELPSVGDLSIQDQWQSLLWAINTAETFGDDGLRGLSLALAKIIQAEGLKKLLLDARLSSQPNLDRFELLWDRDIPVNDAGETLGKFSACPVENFKVTFRKVLMFSSIWERWRLIRALGKLGQDKHWGSWKQTSNHSGIAWQPWPIVWVKNGNHSSMAALLTGEGEFCCNASYDFTSILQSVITDGMNWYRISDNQTLGPVCSIPMAGIFVIGQRLINEKNPTQTLAT